MFGSVPLDSGLVVVQVAMLYQMHYSRDLRTIVSYARLTWQRPTGAP